MTGSEYPERRAQCEEGARLLAGFYPHVRTLRDVTLAQLEAHETDLSPVVARRCRFVIEENQRVIDMAAALVAGDCRQINRLAAASFAGARDLYEISCPEMDKMMAAMSSGPGVIGARQAGAGFGGCLVAFVESGQIDNFARHVRENYYQTTGIWSDIYPVQAAARAGSI